MSCVLGQYEPQLSNHIHDAVRGQRNKQHPRSNKWLAYSSLKQNPVLLLGCTAAWLRTCPDRQERTFSEEDSEKGGP
jgi:hypothetical protein